MKLSRELPELVVEVEDAKFFFEQPAYRDYLEITMAESKPIAEQHKEIFAKLRRVEGVEMEDGAAATADDIRQFQLSTKQALDIIRGYWAAWRKAMGVEADAKNDETKS